MIRYLATLALAIGASFAQADGLDIGKVETIGFHLGSQHLPDKGQNNVNPGAFVRTTEGWAAGGYWNSHRRMSWYAARDWQWGVFGVRAGLVTGYPMGSIVPFVAGTIELPAGFRLAIIPPGEKNSAVVHLVYERSI